jgi:hypothetical protein
MESGLIALILYGDIGSTRSAFTDDNFKELAESLVAAGFNVESVLYHHSKAKQLISDLDRFDAALSWVNPRERLEKSEDNLCLDDVLLAISKKGVFVSTHPEIILKIGTKEVLYTTRHMDWGGDIELYADFEDFKTRFIYSLDKLGVRIIKQYRGESGRGIFKICFEDSDHKNIRVVHAVSGDEAQLFSKNEFYNEFKKYFENNGMLVNQPWANGIANGMVRCYLTGTKVSGFGYQETVALCPQTDDVNSKVRPTSKRFYFSEDCGLFQDLRKIMESKWIPQKQEIHSIADDAMPLLWDADFFINEVNTEKTENKYTLCEINVSSVSPFPPSCVKHIVEALRIRGGQQ